MNIFEDVTARFSYRSNSPPLFACFFIISTCVTARSHVTADISSGVTGVFIWQLLKKLSLFFPLAHVILCNKCVQNACLISWRLSLHNLLKQLPPIHPLAAYLSYRAWFLQQNHKRQTMLIAGSSITLLYILPLLLANMYCCVNRCLRWFMLVVLVT